LREAYQKRDVDACVKLAREYRAAAESYAKVAGWLVEGSSTTTLIDNRRQTIELAGKFTEDFLRRLQQKDPEALAVLLGDATDNRALSAGEP
jgi:hypothetical protein